MLTNDDAKPGVCNTTTLKTEDLVRNLYHIYGAINEGRYVDTVGFKKNYLLNYLKYEKEKNCNRRRKNLLL